MRSGNDGSAIGTIRSSSPKLRRGRKKKVSYDYRGHAHLQQQHGVDEERKKLVKKSILRFVGRTTSADDLKDVLVLTATNYNRVSSDKDGNEGNNVLTHIKPPRRSKKIPASPKSPKKGNRKTTKTEKPKGSDSPKQRKKMNQQDDEVAERKSTSKISKKPKAAEKKEKKMKKKKKKTVYANQDVRAEAAKDKLSTSLHSLHDEEGIDIDVPVKVSSRVASNIVERKIPVKPNEDQRTSITTTNDHSSSSPLLSSPPPVLPQQQQQQRLLPQSHRSVSTTTIKTSVVTTEENRRVAREALSQASVHSQTTACKDQTPTGPKYDDINDEVTGSPKTRSENNTKRQTIQRNAQKKNNDPEEEEESRATQMEHIKRRLWCLLDMDCKDPNTTASLGETYGVAHEDIELAIEHIRIAQVYNNETRWDLIESLFFPDPSTDGHNNDDGILTNVRQLPAKERVNLSSLILPSEMGINKYDNDGDISDNDISSDNLNDNDVDDEKLNDNIDDDGQNQVSLREEYQEVILDVYEAMEGIMGTLPPKDAAMRQQILIHLLRATSEDESHLASLSLDDLHEIINHFELCLEHGGADAIQWSMIQEIVFPLGADDEEMMTDTDVDLRDQELEIVLNHINLATKEEEDIRWDLVAEVLFPCDPIFQQMLGGERSSSAKDETPSTESNKGGSDPARERARAVLNLSNHDFELVEDDDGRNMYGSDNDDDCESFCESI